MGANSLSLPVPVVVVLCFLFVVSSSHAACFDDCIKSFTEGSSPSVKAIAEVVGCTTTCALGEGEGELKTTTEELISLDEKLMEKCKFNLCYRGCRALGGSKESCSKKCHYSQLTSSSNDRDQEMTEVQISFDDKLMEKCKFNLCYRGCRALGGSKESCSKKCHCSQLTSSTNDRDQEMTEELISLDEKLMEKCKYNLCYRGCRALGGSKESCSKKCHCSQVTSSINDCDQEITEELISLDEKLMKKCKHNLCYRACRALGGSKESCSKKCHCSQLTSSTNDRDQEMTDELISLDEKLMEKCKYNLCYRGCRALGGSKESCSKKCHCSQLTSSTNDRDQEVTEELSSLDDKLLEKCKFNLCYRGCRALGGSKESCSKKCHCSQLTFSPFEFNRKVKTTEEEADEEAASAASA